MTREASKIEPRQAAGGILSARPGMAHGPAGGAAAWIDPAKTTVFELLEQAVRTQPAQPAIADADRRLTYAGLWNLADAFRLRLLALGVEPGDLVGVVASRSVATVAAILGVVMAGGCYVPVEAGELPPAVFEQLAAGSGLRCWIADAAARDSRVFSSVPQPVLALEEVSSPLDAEPASVPAPAIDAESPLYLMFTSGSTGAPKGVLVPHRAVARLVSGQSFLEFGPEQTFLLHSPLSFDASTLEAWGSLLTGARLIVAPAGRLGLDDYARLIRERGVTTLWMTAALFHLAAGHAPELFAPLSQLIFGGDVIQPRAVERIRELYPGLRMVNGYGPTENTTFTTCYSVPADYCAEGPLSIGAPIIHTAVHVLDRNLQPVAPGEPGELVTGGAGVALGYSNQPEETLARFVADPAAPDRLLYRTGDLVRERPDGTFDFLGRLDRQVKIAGHRVELDAIESALSEAPGVTEAAVLVVTPAAGEKQLAACISPVAAEAPLRAHLTRQFSSASLPQHWIFFDRLPINANGKLDRAALETEALRRLAPAAAAEEQQHGAGKSIPEITAELQRQWAQMLGRGAVGPEENFFDLGGNSLLLMEMHARLRIRFEDVPTLIEMFGFATPRALAGRLAGGRAAADSGSAGERGQRQRAALLARRRGHAAAETREVR